MRARSSLHAAFPTAISAIAAIAALATTASPALAEDCTPPRVLFVVDASASMLQGIENTTKWEALVGAVEGVLATYPDAAQYGLMTFPGSGGKCAIGDVNIDVAPGTASQIVSKLGTLVIPADAATPAGQSLMKASTYGLITDPGYANYVVFMTDGYQYCYLNNGTACMTTSDCALMGVSPCPTCIPDQPDGCYCIQKWPVLGATALANAGVQTFVVGFGDKVNVKALNQTADAAGTPLPGCDPNANTPSCYYQATKPAELTAAFSTILQQVVVEKCVGACGIEGERTCTVNGWDVCDAPASTSCVSSCGTDGTATCIDDALTPCSSEVDCGGQGGQGGAGPVTSVGAGGEPSSGAVGGGGGTGITGISGDPEEDGACACRTTALGAGKDDARLGVALVLGMAALLRRRRSAIGYSKSTSP